MKKRKLLGLICLICAVIISGCGRSKSAQTDPDDQSVIIVDEAEEGTDDGKDEADEEIGTSVSSDSEEGSAKGIPSLLLFRQKAYEWREENNYPAIEHRFSYFELDGDYAKSNKALADAISEARDEILAKEKKVWDDDLKMIEENELYYYDERFETFLRRVDEKYLSFVNEYVSEGMFDDHIYTEYLAHSYYVDSGKEIAFSDVVADEDAFYDLMADKMFEYMSYVMKNKYMSEVNTDKETLKKDLGEYMKTGDMTWTLDPCGVTCYVRSYLGLAEGFSASILFAEDTDKKIFNDEFRQSVKNEWIMQVPGKIGSYVDIDGMGVAEFVRADEMYDYDPEGLDEFYLSGLYIDCAGAVETFHTVQPGGTDFYDAYLIHKDGSTVLLENHYEYDTAFFNTYRLARHEVSEAGTMRGCFEWASEKDYDINGEGYTPFYVPTDPSHIRVLDGTGEYIGDWSADVMSIDSKGMIETEVE